MELKKIYSYSDKGPYLNLNEDLVDMDLVNNLFQIYDGFGGSLIGDKCVKDLSEEVKKLYAHIGGDPDATLPFFYSSKFLIEGNAIINAALNVHKNLFENNKSKPLGERGGASSIITSQADSILNIFSIGNCKGFVLKNGELGSLNLADSLELLSKDNKNDNTSTAPMAAFGLFENLHYKMNEVRINEGDLFLFLTDGIYSRLNVEEIRSTLVRSNDFKAVIATLCETANNRGNKDNQSAIILSY